MDKKRILLIDDDKELCEELGELLESEGFSATCVTNAAKGEALIKTGNFDIVIMDYKMTGLTGVDILKKLKNKNIKSNIILVSGRPFIEKTLVEEDLEGMVRYVITKPINFEELFSKLHSL